MNTNHFPVLTSPQSNTLTDQEIRWALAIKEKVRESPDLRELSDFEYAQYAVVCQGDMENILYRIQGLQDFREEYRINDNLEEGLDLLQRFTRQHPWFVLDVEYEPQFEHFVCVYDYGRLDPSRCDFPEDYRNYMGGLYYIFQIVHASLSAIREGLVHICECEGLGWKNFSVEFVRRNWYHMIEFYPKKDKEISWLHTSVIANMMHSQYKAMMGEPADIIQVGCQFESYDGRLSEVFKMPNEEIAEARLLERCKMFLMARYYNHQNFSLPATAPPDEEDEEEGDEDEDEDEEDEVDGVGSDEEDDEEDASDYNTEDGDDDTSDGSGDDTNEVPAAQQAA